MNSIGLVFIIIGVILITLSVVAVTVFLILMLIGIKKSAIEFRRFIKKINSELDGVNKVSGVASMRRKLSSLVIKGISFLFYAFLSVSERKNRTHGE
ncbi:MAG: hypothetical protein Ta2C_08580 [Candidatus Endomicrobiellum trichonymphae]|uniref:Uncharacterized protein n=1 Tax=Endomicrobium trichonymphae TaxID=1408204 RepID=A0A6S6NY54_ENDTX|nr:DUF948 domain-containing protein [Candidatus Endomicrobium trichonymphae]BCI50712.1 hypothetical protein TGRD_148 [Candidatus Endomicrobium trichonymphae]BCI50716.1 hypothetical protein TGRD_382 [Candidatus Endomicrobium trichonymphae]GHT05417.1 hypothetical protein AGMMS49523_04780 [Endomicrobiia bacterium]GMO54801.1 MAG: hypothetical protein Ta2C_08580 [Candidatus Endomicrobium trichonymphae]